MHIDQIKKALGISGVQTEVCSWQCKADKEKGIEGSQIDLLIVRKDQVINLCEMKYSQKEYTISNNDNDDFLRKLNDFRLAANTKFAVHLTLITTEGLKQNLYSNTIQNVVIGSDLFEK